MNRLIAGIALATGWAAAQWNRDLHTTEVARFRPLGACISHPSTRTDANGATQARKPKVDIPADHGMEY